MMGILLLLLAVASIFALARSLSGNRLEGAAIAAVVSGSLVVVSTECLSLARALTPACVGTFWLGVTAVAVAVLTWLAWKRRLRQGVREARNSTAGDAPTVLVKALWLSAGTVVAWTAFLAVITPPNSWDGMTYHLPRCMHWMQNTSVRHYPTGIPRQLYFGPCAEFLITHTFLLSGVDRWANLVQWLSMVASVAVAALIARRLGAGQLGQALTAVVVATLPMGILQASSTQNDYVATLWLLCFHYFALRILEGAESARKWPIDPLLCGAALGLALLTKGTAYLFAAPMLLWLTGALLWRERARAVPRLALVAAVVVLVNLGHGMRNFEMFGSPLGPSEETAIYVNARRTPGVTVSNALRNAAMHFRVTRSLRVPIVGGPVNAWVERGVGAAHRVLELDPNDRATTYQSNQFTLKGPAASEDYAGNALHLLLILGVGVALVTSRARRRRVVLVYAATVALGAVLFCAYLKWQPWGTRLHLPLFVLAAPMLAVCLEALLRPRALAVIAGCLLLGTLPFLLMSWTRPLVGSRSVLIASREEQYFVNNPDMLGPYRLACRLVLAQRAEHVGVAVVTWDDWEYPLWLLLGRPGSSVRRIEHLVTADGTALVRTGPIDVVVRTPGPSQAMPRQPLPGWRRLTPEGAVVGVDARTAASQPGNDE